MDRARKREHLPMVLWVGTEGGSGHGGMGNGSMRVITVHLGSLVHTRTGK